jgi:hypothetical protein
MLAGGHYFLNIKQDSVGNRLLLFENKFKFPSNQRPTLSTYKNTIDTMPFECDGNYMYSLGINKNMTNQEIALEYIANMVLWLKADNTAYSDNGTTPCTDGDTVYVWKDRSGSSNDAIQSTAGSRPTYKTNILNGKPVIRISGTNKDFLLQNLDAGNNCSFFMVVIPTSTTPASIFDSSGNSSIDPIRVDPPGYWDSYYQQPSVDMALANANPVLMEFIHSQSGGRTVVYYKNGTFVSTNFNGDTDNIIWDLPRIGSLNNGTPYYNGDIAEFIIYNTTITNANRQLVETYLKGKYGIS